MNVIRDEKTIPMMIMPKQSLLEMVLSSTEVGITLSKDEHHPPTHCGEILGNLHLA